MANNLFDIQKFANIPSGLPWLDMPYDIFFNGYGRASFSYRAIGLGT